MSTLHPTIVETLEQFHITPEQALIAYTVKLVQEKLIALTHEIVDFEEKYHTSWEEFSERLKERREEEIVHEASDRIAWQTAIQSRWNYEQRLLEIAKITHEKDAQ